MKGLNRYDEYTGQPCCFTTKASEDNKLMLMEITNRCNLNCNYCHSFPNSGDELKLSDERLMELFAECKEENFKSVIISGGEPLLSSRVFTVAQAAKTNGLKTDLCTNGTILNDNLLEQIKNNYDSITVTLDTIDPTAYSLMKQCNKEMHYKAVNNLKMLVATDIKVGVTIVLTKHNISKIYNILNFMHVIGVNKISLLRLYHFTPQSSNIDFNYSADVTENIKSAAKLFPNIDIRFKGWDFCSFKCPPCMAGKFIFSVEHGGHLLPCILIRETSSDCNLSQTSLKRAMQSATIGSIMKRIKNMPKCDCTHNSQCSKGCPATAYGNNNQIIPDIRCNEKATHNGGVSIVK